MGCYDAASIASSTCSGTTGSFMHPFRRLCWSVLKRSKQSTTASTFPDSLHFPANTTVYRTYRKAERENENYSVAPFILKRRAYVCVSTLKTSFFHFLSFRDGVKLWIPFSYSTFLHSLPVSQLTTRRPVVDFTRADSQNKFHVFLSFSLHISFSHTGIPLHYSTASLFIFLPVSTISICVTSHLHHFKVSFIITFFPPCQSLSFPT